MQEQQKDEQRLAAQQKLNNDQNYYHDLRNQELGKQKRAQEDKAQDKLYSRMEVGRQEKEEHDRQRFFRYMQGYQDANDLKAKQFATYLAGKDIGSLSQLDEARYLRAVQEKEMKDRKNEQQSSLKYSNEKQKNLEFLRMQMREKQEQKSNEVMQDRYFASALNQQISESLQKD